MPNAFPASTKEASGLASGTAGAAGASAAPNKNGGGWGAPVGAGPGAEGRRTEKAVGEVEVALVDVVVASGGAAEKLNVGGGGNVAVDVGGDAGATPN
jgi:hypothetical protein